jgi:hypothetical protein
VVLVFCSCCLVDSVFLMLVRNLTTKHTNEDRERFVGGVNDDPRINTNSHEINGEFKFEVQQLERQRREL